MKTTEEKIKVMQAFLDGKTIEYGCKDYIDFGFLNKDTTTNPAWNWVKYDYNIKKEKKEGWINIYPMAAQLDRHYCSNVIHPTKQDADKQTNSTRIACVKVEWEEE